MRNFLDILPPAWMLPYFAEGFVATAVLGVSLGAATQLTWTAREYRQRRKQYAQYPLSEFENSKSLFISPSDKSTKLGRWFQNTNNKLTSRLYFPAAKVINDETVGTPDKALATIKQFVRDNGTLSELVFDSHMNTLTVWFGDNSIRLNDLLRSMKKCQDEIGRPLTKRLVITGCAVFTDVPPKWVEGLSRSAGELNADIVGATTIVGLGIWRRTGQFVKFGADGSIDIDYRFDVSKHPRMELVLEQTREENKNSDWFHRARRGPTPRA